MLFRQSALGVRPSIRCTDRVSSVQRRSFMRSSDTGSNMPIPCFEYFSIHSHPGPGCSPILEGGEIKQRQRYFTSFFIFVVVHDP